MFKTRKHHNLYGEHKNLEIQVLWSEEIMVDEDDDEEMVKEGYKLTGTILISLSLLNQLNLFSSKNMILTVLVVCACKILQP